MEVCGGIGVGVGGAGVGCHGNPLFLFNWLQHILVSIIMGALSWQPNWIFTSSVMSNTWFDYSFAFIVLKNMVIHTKTFFPWNVIKSVTSFCEYCNSQLAVMAAILNKKPSAGIWGHFIPGHQVDIQATFLEIAAFYVFSMFNANSPRLRGGLFKMVK